MLLAIDVGNTNVVFALVEGDTIRWRWRVASCWAVWAPWPWAAAMPPC